MKKENPFKVAGIVCMFMIAVFVLTSCGNGKEISDVEGNREFTEMTESTEMEEYTETEESTDMEETTDMVVSSESTDSMEKAEATEISETEGKVDTEETVKTESTTGNGNFSEPEESIKAEESVNRENSTATEKPVSSESPVETEEVEIVPQISMEAFDLINAERVKLGLEPAVWDAECERIACIRAEEIYALGYDIYFSDMDPHSGFKKFFIENNSLSECLAFGASNAEGVLDMWMNSEGHRTILMKDNRVYLAVAQIGDRWVAINSN